MNQRCLLGRKFTLKCVYWVHRLIRFYSIGLMEDSLLRCLLHFSFLRVKFLRELTVFIGSQIYLKRCLLGPLDYLAWRTQELRSINIFNNLKNHKKQRFFKVEFSSELGFFFGTQIYVWRCVTNQRDNKISFNGIIRGLFSEIVATIFLVFNLIVNPW